MCVICVVDGWLEETLMYQTVDAHQEYFQPMQGSFIIAYQHSKRKGEI
jgi:hypothetical protein